MKLIIDIPEEDYKTIRQRPKQCVVHWDIVDALRNGTPLDDVKAEIKKNILDEPVENGTNAEMACYNGGLLKCLEIIDKYIGKAESEEE